MKSPERIAILVHEQRTIGEHPPFIMFEVANAWRRMGIEIRLLRGVSQDCEADLLLNHVDVTVMPEEYRRFMGQYPRVANQAILDISKRKVSSNLVRPNDGYEGPVIVKTNLNSGGGPERSRGGSGPVLADDLAVTECIDPNRYPVFDTVNSMPKEIFENKALVVEKFLPERDGPHYCIRSYTFGGGQGWCTRRKSSHPVVKRYSIIANDVVEVHPEILRKRREFGIDFGKIDYVIHDGKPVLLDINHCPTYPSPGQTVMRSIRAETYAQGLLISFFGDANETSTSA